MPGVKLRLSAVCRICYSTWFSNATASPGARFVLQYDSLSGSCKSAFEVDVGSSGTWLEKTVTVQDARFGEQQLQPH
jgi:hypothetical protein